VKYSVVVREVNCGGTWSIVWRCVKYCVELREVWCGGT